MTRYALQTRRLRKIYGEGEARVEALAGVDLDIPVGEFVSIMGPSGSGKSTLLHMIGLLDSPTSGGVRIMGRDASRLTTLERTLARRELLGFVFQAFHLIPRASAIRNVMLPMAFAGIPRGDREKRAERVLRAVGLGDRMKNTPSQLSGGQKQRVAIARALALDPPIILADEPTGNLDSTTSMEIMELFQDLHQRGKTVIQVTHEDTMAAFGQRIVEIRDGRVDSTRATEGRREARPAARAPQQPEAPQPDSPARRGSKRRRSEAPRHQEAPGPRPQAPGTRGRPIQRGRPVEEP